MCEALEKSFIMQLNGMPTEVSRMASVYTKTDTYLTYW